MSITLICTTCNEEKSENNFYKSKLVPSRNYREYSCKSCHYKRKTLSTYNQGENLNSYITRLTTKCKNRAKAKLLVFELDKEYVLDLFNRQNHKCALSNIDMTYFVGGRGKVNTNISIDRINPKIGYTKENVQLVCCIINTMKNNSTMEDFIKYCKLVIDNDR